MEFGLKAISRANYNLLTFITIVSLSISGCSETRANEPDCSEFNIGVQDLREEFNAVPWHYYDEKIPVGRKYANFVLSAPEGCATLEEIAEAKTLLMTLDDLGN